MVRVVHLAKTSRGWGLISEDIFHLLPPRWQNNPIEAIENLETPSYDKLKINEIIDLLEPPMIGNPKIVCVGRNYLEHILELGNDPEEVRKKGPVLFLKPSSAIIGPGERIILPSGSKRVDHEIELAVVMGKKTKNVSRELALNHILGYSILIDVTARDWQREDKTWFRGKALDTFAPFGPWITLPSDDFNPQSLKLVLTVNDETKQEGNTKDMLFKIDELIAIISQYVTLLPGDVIATGTPLGVSPLQDGDNISATIEHIGTLKVVVSKTTNL